MKRDELSERLGIIETMIDEGRRDTEYWGWAFVLWGTGHVIALLWSQTSELAWLITMHACVVGMMIGVWRRRGRSRKSTTLGRALGAIWGSFGIGMFIAGMGGGLSGALSGEDIVLVFCTLMGAACFASGIIVRWPWWSTLGLLWWAAAGVCMFVTPEVIYWLFVVMALVGEIAFGAILMVLERREGVGAEAAAA